MALEKFSNGESHSSVRAKLNLAIDALNKLLEVPATPLAATATQTPATTYGGSDGSITLTASGGGPLEYSKLEAGPYQDSNILTGFTAGSKTVWVRDKATPSSKVSVTITVRQAAPVLSDNISVTDGLNKSFDWTNLAGFLALADYEYQLKAAAITTVTGKPQGISNQAYAIGEIKLRLKAGATYDASAWISNQAALDLWVAPTGTIGASKSSVMGSDTFTLNWDITLNSSPTVTNRRIQTSIDSGATWQEGTALNANSGTTAAMTQAQSTRYRLAFVDSEGVTRTSSHVSVAYTAEPSYNTTITSGQSTGGVTLNGVTGLSFKFNTPQPAGDPFPAVMELFAGATAIGQVDFNTPYIGQICAIVHNGATYHKTFINGTLNILA